MMAISQLEFSSFTRGLSLHRLTKKIYLPFNLIMFFFSQMEPIKCYPALKASLFRASATYGTSEPGQGKPTIIVTSTYYCAFKVSCHLSLENKSGT